jgi:hypothetical protein
MHIWSISYTQHHCYVLPKKTYTHAGFERGSSVPHSDAMTTEPRQLKQSLMSGANPTTVSYLQRCKNLQHNQYPIFVL